MMTRPRMTVKIDASGGKVLRLDKHGVVIALNELYPGVYGMLHLVSAKEGASEDCVLHSSTINVGPQGGFGSPQKA